MYYYDFMNIITTHVYHSNAYLFPDLRETLLLNLSRNCITILHLRVMTGIDDDTFMLNSLQLLL